MTLMWKIGSVRKTVQHATLCAQTLNDLREKITGHSIISHHGDVKWSPRSCYLTPLDYCGLPLA